MNVLASTFVVIVISSQLEGAVRPKFRRGYFPNEFECSDGTFIAADKTCDGTVDCLDGSDETHHLCRETPCPDHLFRCTYGACVDGTAPCDGVTDCADNSDELQPKCNNYTFEIGRQFKCNDSSLIESDRRCDGIRDCSDGFDETLVACAGTVCASNLFQCAYGACVDEGADCNHIQECADGSDESDKLCNKTVPRRTTTTTTPSTTTVGVPNMCVLPPHPENGLFLRNDISAKYRAGDVAYSVSFNITCIPGYKVVGESVVVCYFGHWIPTKLPSCVSACSLNPSVSMKFRCLLCEKGTVDIRDCKEVEVLGTVVTHEYRRPKDYNPTPLRLVYCTGVGWTYEPTDLAKCGTPTSRGEFPWHVAVYRRDDGPDGPVGAYQQICGGSLVNECSVITAAHCVWMDNNNGVMPVEYFMVAAGKLYRELNDPRDELYQQTSQVSEIHVPERYGGANLHYQADLAVVKVKDGFVFSIYVRPVCLDLSSVFDEFQLKKGSMGRAAGWGLTRSRRGTESTKREVVDMQYLEWQECKGRIPDEYYITDDKICAGFGNGTTLCKGDSGSGLVFCAREHGVVRCYLRGVLSTALPHPDGSGCINPEAIIMFTHLQKYERFLRRQQANDQRHCTGVALIL